MKLISFVLKNLGRRKIRTGLTVLGIAIALAFSFILLSVNAGSGKMVAGAERLGPDVEVKVAGGEFEEVYGSSISENYADDLAKVDGVRKATPVIMTESMKLGGRGFMAMTAVIPSEAREVYSDINIDKGRYLKDDDNYAIVLGHQAAKLNDLDLGDNFEFGGENFEVVGIFEERGTIIDVICELPLKAMQSVRPGFENRATGIWIWVKEDAHAGVVMERIENKNPDLRATEGIAILEQTEEFTKFGDAVRLVIITVAVLIGALAAMNTVTMSTFERTREFGTMRALGASGGYIFKLVLVESIVLCVIGGLIGCLLGFAGSLVAESVILDMVGLDIVALPWTVPAMVIGIAIIVGLVAGIYPARRVSKQEIVEALRYE